ncbi:MAG: sortase [Actinomycetes bacterium]
MATTLSPPQVGTPAAAVSPGSELGSPPVSVAASAGTHQALRVTTGQARRAASPAVLFAGVAVTLIGLLLISFVGFLFVGSDVLEQRTQVILYDQLRGELKTATAPVDRPLTPGEPLAVLTISRIGVDAVVVAGTTGGDLAKGPGLRSDSVLPGQQGSAVIQGRRLAYGGPFADLDQLAVGDTISVVTGQGEFQYTVDLARRSDESVLAPPASSARLTLVTADPFLAPSRSLIVSAALTRGTGQPATAVAPAIPAEAPLAGNPGAALSLALWAQALVLAVLAIAWLWRRVPNTVLWVGAAPVVLALLWSLCNSLAELLPNTL